MIKLRVIQHMLTQPISMLKYAFLIPFTFIIASFFWGDQHTMKPGDPIPEGATYIEPSEQRPGDPEAGKQYLLYGDYVSSGVPLDIFKAVFGASSPDDLGRAGDNAGISARYNVVISSNGVKVVAPNCMSCHIEKINGQLVFGLGNNTFDYTSNQSSTVTGVDLAITLKHGRKSPEWEAYLPFRTGTLAVAPYIVTKTRGVNPADKIFAALSRHRNPDDMQWIVDATTELPEAVIPTDVPAWWLMKKKNALYYNGLGKGDFGRLATASGLLTMKDSAEIRRIDSHFADVMAFLRTVEPPVYPYKIDLTLAQQGKAVFENNCSKCHGKYGKENTYPNLLIDLNTIGTDPSLANQYQAYPQYHNWYNMSWFSKGPGAANLLPTGGYVAPPLDGIWATSPYLHNGSVPTLEDMLNSAQRPVYWKRSFTNSEYDEVKGGWKYVTSDRKKDDATYDTTIPGYGNGGHYFGDVLSDSERKAVIEYLKTL